MSGRRRSGRRVADSDEDDEPVAVVAEESEQDDDSDDAPAPPSKRAAGKAPARGGNKGKRPAVAESEESEAEEDDEEYEEDEGNRSRSKGKSPASRKRRAADADDDERDGAPSSSQKDGPRPRKVGGGGGDAALLSDADVTRKARDLARLALFYARRRTALRREDMKKHLFKEGAYNSRSLDRALDEAQGILRNVFGMELVQLPKGEGRTGGQLKSIQEQRAVGAASGGYMLVSSLKYDRHVSLEVTDREDANAVDGFLYTLLLLIALSNHAISDDILNANLERLGHARNSAVGGSTVELLLKRFIDDRYISKVKVASSGEEAFEYRWGPRAKVEVDLSACVDLVGQVMDVSDNPVEMSSIRRAVMQAQEAQDAAFAPPATQGEAAEQPAASQAEAAPSSSQRGRRKAR